MLRGWRRLSEEDRTAYLDSPLKPSNMTFSARKEFEKGIRDFMDRSGCSVTDQCGDQWLYTGKSRPEVKVDVVDGKLALSFAIGTKAEGVLLRDYLRKQIGLSRRLLTAVKHRGGGIYVNGQPDSVRRLLAAGDRLTLIFPPEEPGDGLIPEPVPLEVVYEDTAVLIINKPAGMATVPGFQHRRGTLAGGVLWHLRKNGLRSTAHIATRLDRQTSGLVLAAKHGFFHEAFARQKKTHALERRYIAIVHGRLARDEGVIDAPIARKEGSIIERIVSDGGQRAVTHYRVLRRLDEATVVDIALETGRTHQIRVHFAHIGHPLLGDDLYGGRTDRIGRQALHCYRLCFVHPVSHEPLSFASELPEDMRRVLASAGCPQGLDSNA